MRLLLGTALLVPALLLAACSGSDDGSGGGGGDTATDPTSSSSSTSAAAGGVDFDATLVNATAAGGQPSELLTPVGTPDQIATFVAQFRSPDFGADVEAAVAAAGEGDVYAAIVGLGCDVPPGVEVTEGEAGYVVEAQKVADPLPECLAPVTTVAVVTIR